jgi:hypothetical protein
MWDLKVCIVGDNFSNEALLVEIYVGTAFHKLSSNIPILIDGVSLTGHKFKRSHPVVLYQYSTLTNLLCLLTDN